MSLSKLVPALLPFPFAQKGFYPTKSLQIPIWIEKIGPLKLFVVLVPGLLRNFGWEVTIKIHYSTVSGGGHSKLNPFIFNHIIIIVRIEGISFCCMFFLLAAGNLNICLHEVRYLLLQPNTD